jgi:cytoskeleton-associated protein 5
MKAIILLNNLIKKIVAKDANVNIVIVAAKCITGIANGVRKDFNKYALMALEPLMERFKEKKQHIVDALREACDAIYTSTNLEAIQEMAIGFLGHKTPVVRQQVALFLARCFAMSTQTTLPKKVLKAYLPPLVKNLSEADPSVRDSSSEALGAIYKALGEKIFMPNVGELEQIKLDKIKEYSDKCVLLNLRGEPRMTAAAVAPAPAKPAVSSASSSSINSATIKKPTISKPTADSSASVSKPKPGGPPKPSGDAAKKVVKGGGSINADAKKSIPEEPDLSQETVEERAAELFGAETINNLANSNWKERQSAIENLANAVKRMPTDEVPCQIVVRTVAKKPGFKDAHFQVLKQRLELITSIADQGFKFSQRSASYCVAEISDKIGDVKTSQQAKDALSKISEQCTLPYVITQIIGPIFEGKNPKNQENFLLWLSQAIKEFGFQGIDMKSLLQHIKSALQNTNPAVRVASIQLISTIYMYMGANFRALFDQEKPALLEQIDAEIEKVKGMKPPAPIRGKNSASAQSNSGGNGDNEEEAEEDDPIKQQLQAEAMMPRTDISSQLTDQLMDQLNDKNWKERQAALEKLETILRENKFIEPNLNEFPTHLNKRLIDTNKILATTALKISEKLAQALGSQGRRFIPTLASGMIGALSDNKETLRKTAIAALNAWFDNCGGLAPFIENDLLMESFSSATNPNVKAELCGWLVTVMPKCKPGKLPPELKAIIPSVYAFVEDRNPDVRTKAQDLILPLMTHVGANDMLRVMQKAKPTSVTVLQPLIEKARAEMAARQPPPAAVPPKQASASSGARVVKPPVKDIYAEDDTNGDDYGSSAPSVPPPTAPKKDTKAPVNAKKVFSSNN